MTGSPIVYLVIGLVLLVLSLWSGFFIILAVPYFFALLPFGLEKATGITQGLGTLFYCMIGMVLSVIIARKKLMEFGKRRGAGVG